MWDHQPTCNWELHLQLVATSGGPFTLVAEVIWFGLIADPGIGPMPPTTSSMAAAIETPVPDEPCQNTKPQLPWNAMEQHSEICSRSHECPGVYTEIEVSCCNVAGWLLEPISRAALLVEGTAFKKVARLDPAKLRVNDA